MCVFILNGTIGNAIDWPCITNSRMSTIVDAGGPFYRLVNRQMEGYDTVATAIGDVGDVVGTSGVERQIRMDFLVVVVRQLVATNRHVRINAEGNDVEKCDGIYGALSSRVGNFNHVHMRTHFRFGSGNGSVQRISVEIATLRTSPMIEKTLCFRFGLCAEGVVRTIAARRFIRRNRKVQIRIYRNLNSIGITHTAGVFGAIAQPSAVPCGVFVPIVGIDHIVHFRQVAVLRFGEVPALTEDVQAACVRNFRLVNREFHSGTQGFGNLDCRHLRNIGDV